MLNDEFSKERYHTNEGASACRVKFVFSNAERFYNELFLYKSIRESHL